MKSVWSGRGSNDRDLSFSRRVCYGCAPDLLFFLLHLTRPSNLSHCFTFPERPVDAYAILTSWRVLAFDFYIFRSNQRCLSYQNYQNSAPVYLVHCASDTHSSTRTCIVSRFDDNLTNYDPLVTYLWSRMIRNCSNPNSDFTRSGAFSSILLVVLEAIMLRAWNNEIT